MDDFFGFWVSGIWYLVLGFHFSLLLFVYLRMFVDSLVVNLVVT